MELHISYLASPYVFCYKLISFPVSVLTLQELCSRAIVASTTVYGIEHLPLPQPIKSHLKSYTIHNHTTRLRQVCCCVPPLEAKTATLDLMYQLIIEKLRF